MRMGMTIGLGILAAVLVTGCSDKEKDRLTKREQDRLSFQLSDMERDLADTKASLAAAEKDAAASKQQAAELSAELKRSRDGERATKAAAVPQEKFDGLVKERDALQQKLEAQQAEIDRLTTDLAKMKQAPTAPTTAPNLNK